MARRFIWINRYGQELVINPDRGPVSFSAADGLSSSAAVPAGVQGPGQVGETAVGVTVGSRVVSLTLGIQARTSAELARLRREVIAAFSDTTDPDEEVPTPGVLRFEEDGTDPVEIEAYPRDSPSPSSMDFTQTLQELDVELWAPDSRWRAVADEVLVLDNFDGGFTMPLTMPHYSLTKNVEGNVHNAGNVPAPIVARLHGDFIGGTLSCETTGKAIRIEGAVDPDEYVEVGTGYGAKYVRLVNKSTGVTTDAIGRLNVVDSEFFELPRGSSVLRFEADINLSGYAEVFYRPLWSGV